MKTETNGVITKKPFPLQADLITFRLLRCSTRPETRKGETGEIRRQRCRAITVQLLHRLSQTILLNSTIQFKHLFREIIRIQFHNFCQLETSKCQLQLFSEHRIIHSFQTFAQSF
jgi:hypothetical protein